MIHRKRIHDTILTHHVEHGRQMACVAGPRQAGKTTLCRNLSSVYMDWDNVDHRRIFLRGPSATAQHPGWEQLRAGTVVATFDELHKYAGWTSFLKGFRRPHSIPKAEFAALWEHGGYPEPFLKRVIRFTRRWRSLRQALLVREDIRDLTRIHELGQIQVLIDLLADRSADRLVYSNLAREAQVAVDTLRRWIETLCSFYLGFLLRRSV
jgi:uncharacterized protein